MPIQAGALKKDKKSLTIPIEDVGDVQVAYRPSAHTPVTEDTIKEYSDASRDANGLAFLLSQFLIEWDIMEGKEMLAPTFEHLRELPSKFLADILLAISNDMNPSDRKSGT